MPLHRDTAQNEEKGVVINTKYLWSHINNLRQKSLGTLMSHVLITIYIHLEERIIAKQQLLPRFKHNGYT